MTNSFLRRILFQIAVIAGLGIVVVLILVFIGLDIKKKSNAIKAANEQVYRNLQSAEELTRLRAEAAVARPALERLQLKIPERDRLLAFAGFARDLASNANLVSTFRFGSETPGDPIGAIQFITTLRGDFFDIRQFVKGLENSPYFVTLRDVSASGSLTGIDAGAVSGTVLYKSKENEETQ